MYRQNAEISALSSGELDKYEYLTGKDLQYKPSLLQKAKLEYSPLGQVFKKGLKKDGKSEGLLKRLKNIEDKTDNNLRAIEGPRREDPDLRNIYERFRGQLTPEGNNIFNQILNERRQINNYIQNNFRRGNNHTYSFSNYTRKGDLFRRIYNGEMMIPEADREQNALNNDYDRLQKYRPNQNSCFFQIREDILNNITHLREGRRLLTDAFRNRIFPLRDPALYPQYRDDKSSSDSSDSDDGNGNNGGNNGNNGQSGSNINKSQKLHEKL